MSPRQAPTATDSCQQKPQKLAHPRARLSVATGVFWKAFPHNSRTTRARSRLPVERPSARLVLNCRPILTPSSVLYSFLPHRRGASALELHFSIQYSPSAETSFRVTFPSGANSTRPVYLPNPLRPRNLPVPPVIRYVPVNVAFLLPSGFVTAWLMFCHSAKLMSPFSYRHEP